MTVRVEREYPTQEEAEAQVVAWKNDGCLVWGYGLYGTDVRERDGQWVASMIRGSTCD